MLASSLIHCNTLLVAAVGDPGVYAERDISREKPKGLAAGCDASSIKKVKEEMVFKARETGELYVDCFLVLMVCLRCWGLRFRFSPTRWPRSRMIN